MADPPIDIATSDLGVGASGQGTNNPNYIPSTLLSYDSGTVQKFSGGSGTSNQVSCNILNIGGWKFQAYEDGIYVTTPSGILTKLELVDTRYIPVPQPTALDHINIRTNVLLDTVPGGPQKTPGGQLGKGNATGGGGAIGSTLTSPGMPFVADVANKITPSGDGQGFSAATAEAISKLPPSMNNPQFIGALNSISEVKNISANSLLSVMQVNSGFTGVDQIGKGFAAVNQLTNAAGLMQIMPDAAKNLGYNITQIQGMSAADQMSGPITSYLNHITLPDKPTSSDLYLANFFPSAIGKPDANVIGNIPGLSPQNIASLNPSFVGAGGLVTNGSIKNWLQTNYPSV
jgi:Transglycosylase SLT domain